MIQLSTNFTLFEMVRSQKATQYRYVEQFNPSQEIRNNLSFLAVSLLQPFRDFIGGPVNILSGFRCSRVNKVVKGSKSSDHMKGLAADTIFDLKKWAKFVEFFETDCREFDQVIVYTNKNDEVRFVHMSCRPTENRKEYLLSKKGRKATVVSKAVFMKYVVDLV